MKLVKTKTFFVLLVAFWLGQGDTHYTRHNEATNKLISEAHECEEHSIEEDGHTATHDYQLQTTICQAGTSGFTHLDGRIYKHNKQRAPPYPPCFC